MLFFEIPDYLIIWFLNPQMPYCKLRSGRWIVSPGLWFTSSISWLLDLNHSHANILFFIYKGTQATVFSSILWPLFVWTIFWFILFLLTGINSYFHVLYSICLIFTHSFMSLKSLRLCHKLFPSVTFISAVNITVTTYFPSSKAQYKL